MEREEQCQLCGRKGNNTTDCGKFVNNTIARDIYRKHPELERQVLKTHKKMINMGNQYPTIIT